MDDFYFSKMADWRYPVTMSHNSKNVIDPMHFHNFVQIFRINSGSCLHLVGDVSTALMPGAISIIPEGVPHLTDARHADNDLYLFSMNQRMFSGIPDNTWSFYNICIEPLCNTVHRHGTVFYPSAQTDAEIVDLLREIYAELQNFFDEKHWFMRGKSVELMSLIAAEYAAQKGPLDTTGMAEYCPSIHTAFSYIHRNYGNPDLAADDVARIAAMSPRSFSRIFKNTMGVPFIQYVQYLRIYNAKRLLAETDRILPDLISEIGFNNLANFHRSFRNQTGFTPREWRLYTHHRLCAYPQREIV